MKKIILIALITIISSLALVADAQVIQTSSLASIIEAQQIRELRAKGYKNVEAKVLHIPIEKIALADGAVSVRITSNSPRLAAREYKKVDIYVNSKYQRSLGVPLEIKIYDDVMVAKDIISKDSQISAKNVEFKYQNILASSQQCLNRKALGSEIIVTRMFRPGEVIDQRFCKSKPDIVRSAMVKVIFKTDNEMAITVDGIALTEGKVGDFISVENKTYKKVYTGKVVGVNKVLVEI